MLRPRRWPDEVEFECRIGMVNGATSTTLNYHTHTVSNSVDMRKIRFWWLITIDYNSVDVKYYCLSELDMYHRCCSLVDNLMGCNLGFLPASHCHLGPVVRRQTIYNILSPYIGSSDTCLSHLEDSAELRPYIFYFFASSV